MCHLQIVTYSLLNWRLEKEAVIRIFKQKRLKELKTFITAQKSLKLCKRYWEDAGYIREKLADIELGSDVPQDKRFAQLIERVTPRDRTVLEHQRIKDFYAGWNAWQKHRQPKITVLKEALQSYFHK